MNIQDFEKALLEKFNQYELKEDLEFLGETLLIAPKTSYVSSSGDFLTDLFDNYELAGRTIGFDLNDVIEETSDYRFFASQDVMQIGVDRKSGNVVMYDPYEEVVEYKMAPNLESFLSIMLKLYEYGLPGWFHNHQYTKQDRQKLLGEIQHQLSEDFLEYYRNAYGI